MSTCRCGADQRRTEEPLPSGNRQITLACAYCGRQEIELRSPNGLLLRWMMKRRAQEDRSSGTRYMADA